MGWTVMKKRKSYLSKPSDSVSVKAGDRLDAIHAAQDEDEDPRKSGPFAEPGGAPSLTVVVPPPGGAGASGGAGTADLSPGDHSTLADLHQQIANIHSKLARPGTDTIPHTTSVPRSDKDELSDDIDME